MKLEQLLHYFHVTCEPAVAGLQVVERASFVANVACTAADAFFACKRAPEFSDALLRATKKYWDDVEKLQQAKTPPQGCPTPMQTWMRVDAVEMPKVKSPSRKTADSANSAEAQLLPKVILYDDATGAPKAQQDTRTEEQQEPASLVMIPWKEWMVSDVAQGLDENAAAVAAATMVLRSLHHRGNVHNQNVDVKVNMETKQKTVVVASALDPEALELPPCAPASGKLHPTSSHPFRVPIVITWRKDTQGAASRRVSEKKPDDAVASGESAEDGLVTTERTCYLHPEYKMPEDATPDDALASGSSCERRAWEWKGSESLHPYWAVTRLTPDELSKKNFVEKCKHAFNVTLKLKQFNVVTVGSLGDESIAETVSVTVPIMTNSVELAAGTELLMESTRKAPVCHKRKSVTWKDDVVSAAKAKARAAKAKPKASLGLQIESEV